MLSETAENPAETAEDYVSATILAPDQCRRAQCQQQSCALSTGGGDVGDPA